VNRIVCALAVILAATGAVSGVRAFHPLQQAEPIAIDAYWLKVQETLSVVEALEQADALVVGNSLKTQAAAWEAIKQVRLNSGVFVPVDHSYLVGLLRAEPVDLDGLRTYLRTLLDENRRLQASSSSSTKPAADYSKALATILARKEFNWETASSRNPIQEWLDRLWQRFWEWLNSVLSSVGIGGSSAIQWVVGLVGTLILALVLFYVLRGLVGNVSYETAWQDGDVDFLEIISAEGAARRAEETARLGDYRSAVRWLYLSSLLVLEERGLLRYDRSRTNREYLRSVAHLPELSAVLRDVIDVFDRVWYGIAPIDEADFTRYAARVADLRQMQ
jgi:hypothetical protein